MSSKNDYFTIDELDKDAEIQRITFVHSLLLPVVDYSLNPKTEKESLNYYWLFKKSKNKNWMDISFFNFNADAVIHKKESVYSVKTSWSEDFIKTGSLVQSDFINKLYSAINDKCDIVIDQLRSNLVKKHNILGSILNIKLIKSESPTVYFRISKTNNKQTMYICFFYYVDQYQTVEEFLKIIKDDSYRLENDILKRINNNEYGLYDEILKRRKLPLFESMSFDKSNLNCLLLKYKDSDQSIMVNDISNIEILNNLQTGEINLLMRRDDAELIPQYFMDKKNLNNPFYKLHNAINYISDQNISPWNYLSVSDTLSIMPGLIASIKNEKDTAFYHFYICISLIEKVKPDFDDIMMTDFYSEVKKIISCRNGIIRNTLDGRVICELKIPASGRNSLENSNISLISKFIFEIAEEVWRINEGIFISMNYPGYNLVTFDKIRNENGYEKLACRFTDLNDIFPENLTGMIICMPGESDYGIVKECFDKSYNPEEFYYHEIKGDNKEIQRVFIGRVSEKGINSQILTASLSGNFKACNHNANVNISETINYKYLHELKEDDKFDPDRLDIKKPVDKSRISDEFLKLEIEVKKAVDQIGIFVENQKQHHIEGMFSPGFYSFNIILKNSLGKNHSITIRSKLKDDYAHPIISTVEFVPSLSELHVFGVAVQDYISMSKLSCPRNDVDSFINILKLQNDIYSNISTYKYTDSSIADWNYLEKRDSVLNKLQEVSTSCRKRSKVLLFLSGHGMINDVGEFYFLLQESNVNNYKESGISFQELLDTGMRLQKRECEFIIFIDTCRNFLFEDGKTFEDRTEPKILNRRIDAYGLNNTAICFSTAQGKSAYERSGEKYSLFTGALIEFLTGNVTFPGKKVSLKDIDYHVTSILKSYGGEQSPEFITSGGDNIFLLKQISDFK